MQNSFYLRKTSLRVSARSRGDANQDKTTQTPLSSLPFPILEQMGLQRHICDKAHFALRRYLGLSFVVSSVRIEVAWEFFPFLPRLFSLPWPLKPISCYSGAPSLILIGLKSSTPRRLSPLLWHFVDNSNEPEWLYWPILTECVWLHKRYKVKLWPTLDSVPLDESLVTKSFWTRWVPKTAETTKCRRPPGC